MTKSTISDNFFSRIEFIVDKYYSGNQSAFARDMGVKRQYVNKWYKEYEDEGKQPNPGQTILSSMVSGIIKYTDINPIWFITGVGNREVDDSLIKVADSFVRYEDSLNGLNNADVSQDELVEFLAKQQEAVLDFLRKMKKNRDSDEK